MCFHVWKFFSCALGVLGVCWNFHQVILSNVLKRQSFTAIAANFNVKLVENFAIYVEVIKWNRKSVEEEGSVKFKEKQ
jgi:hypothetical protein